MKSLITKRSRSCRKCGSKNLVDYKVWYGRGEDLVYVYEPVEITDAHAACMEEAYRCGDCGKEFHKQYIAPSCIKEFDIDEIQPVHIGS